MSELRDTVIAAAQLFGKLPKGPMMSFDTESRGYITASEIRQGRKDLHAKIFGIESHKIDVAIGGQDYALSVRIEKK